MEETNSEAQALDKLADLLTELTVDPYNIVLHAQHIALALSLPDMESQVTEARQTAANYLAVGDEVWVPLIEAKVASVDIDSPAVLEVLELYARAESDYLSIPILQRHVEFLIDRHAYFSTLDTKPEELGDLFSPAWTRDAISMTVEKGLVHISKSQQIWRLQSDWELEMLPAAPQEEKQSLVEHVQSLILARLKQPHAGYEGTFQSYSSFTTAYKPQSEYERLMVSASKLRARAVKGYETRETTELALTSLDSYAQYLASERRVKHQDHFVITGIHERAIAEAAQRCFAGKAGAEEALRTFWTGYLDFLREREIGPEEMMATFRRATRSVPGSGEVWARYIRHLEQRETLDLEETSMEDTESISNAYNRALSTNLFTKLSSESANRDPEQIVLLVLARASAEKHFIEAGRGSEDAFSTLVKVVEDGLAMVRHASKAGDPRFRLEKFLSELYLNAVDLPDAAIQLWASTAKHYKSSWASWVAYTDVLIRTDRHDQARSTFQEVSTKNLDYPEALWDAWLNFEYAHGSLASLENALARVERARAQVEARRMRETQKAYGAAQHVMEQQAASEPVAPAPLADGAQGIPPNGVMDVDLPTSDHHGKRKARDDEHSEGGDNKKPRLGTPSVPLKRDRENCTVFVADLPPGTNEDQLRALFKDCGDVRLAKITQLPQLLVATIEFTTRDSIPPALTKDKKRISGVEVSVHLAWRSTLYVTNFPEKWDDSSVREVFGQYGHVFDVRWPSKKFKSTRRFCYVQYTSPQSAEGALELHGREFEPERALNVYISNPGHKKERTDAYANERELYVAGLSKSTTKGDLEKLFATYGSVKDVRLAEDKNGQPKGFAFIEFHNEADARAALSLNNHELKRRRIAVTLADTHVRPKNRDALPDDGLGKGAEVRNRSVRIRNLPPDGQEGLLQQVLEKHAAVKRVEIFAGQREAVVELENAVEAGKLLLRTEPVVFDGAKLDMSEETPSASSRTMIAAPPSLFIPRKAMSRRLPRKPPSEKSGQDQGAGKNQDDFRQMLAQ